MKIKLFIDNEKEDGSFGYRTIYKQKKTNFWSESIISIINNSNDLLFEYVTNKNDSDFILVTEDLKGNLNNFENKYNKKCIIFYPWDDGHIYTNLDKNTIIFKRSLYNNKNAINEYVYPGYPHSNWIANNLDYKIIYNTKIQKPIIGFCGKLSHELRNQSIDIINEKFKTDFIIREEFFAGNLDLTVARKEYINNMNNSTFSLCIRGAGNFSYRLYEAMSMGKVPIIIDDNAPYPSKEYINWNKYLIIKKEDIKYINNKILDYYNSFTNESWIKFQNEIRYDWVTYLAPYSFNKSIYNILDKNKK